MLTIMLFNSNANSKCHVLSLIFRAELSTWREVYPVKDSQETGWAWPVKYSWSRWSRTPYLPVTVKGSLNNATLSQKMKNQDECYKSVHKCKPYKKAEERMNNKKKKRHKPNAFSTSNFCIVTEQNSLLRSTEVL